MQTLPPKMRKPTSAKVGSLEISKSLAAIDTSDFSESLTSLQAARIMRRFPMSVPLALATARLAYGGAA
ncbi:hypothetical protein EN745_13650 [Mesorhizobium sp. M4A.F.Ca.ET.022.05.2.1]|uniref:hypothetical protein n=1 Tax=Mesorhizobium sp. M4A.F.Ca.ET.022.05.2.1 TaxID=2496653 RepID=UPI000FCC26C1|nr:hypothetical protein [Mesorhizobium sp. M4A.F.Ca.ET.022.05.2.1]RVC80214.1 hypothetical protein EN745_13650 [Mesorhizobium sp. M4A.F.Ca.ET.022.05.2.1]